MEFNTENIDREQLREERKLRKKLKKEQKSLERQKIHEQQLLELRLGPRDQHVRIITQQFADNLQNNPTRPLKSLSINEDDFPKLGDRAKPKSPQKIHTIEPTIQETTPKKPTKNSAIKIDLIEILSKPEIQPVIKQKETNKIYKGNPLDSSRPDRKHGKFRECPKVKKPNSFKLKILNEEVVETKIYDDIHSPKFETYCDNCIDEKLNETTELFLREIVRFQEKLYGRDQIKGASRRRYVCGFREVRKLLILKKIKILVIAPNVKVLTNNGVLDATINELKDIARDNGTPYMFALHKRKFGQITLKKIPVSCVGVLDYSGAEELFKRLVLQLGGAKELYASLTRPEATDGDRQLTDNVVGALE